MSRSGFEGRRQRDGQCRRPRRSRRHFSPPFDALGRPYNKADSGIAGSTFNAPLAITFASGGNSDQITIHPETGYVQ
jgi:hypothetical protein